MCGYLYLFINFSASWCLWEAEKPFGLLNKEMGYLWDRGKPQSLKYFQLWGQLKEIGIMCLPQVKVQILFIQQINLGWSSRKIFIKFNKKKILLLTIIEDAFLLSKEMMGTFWKHHLFHTESHSIQGSFGVYRVHHLVCPFDEKFSPCCFFILIKCHDTLKCALA